MHRSIPQPIILADEYLMDPSPETIQWISTILVSDYGSRVHVIKFLESLADLLDSIGY